MGNRDRATSKMARRAKFCVQSDCQNCLHMPAIDWLSLLPKSAIHTSTKESKSGIFSTGTRSTTRPRGELRQLKEADKLGNEDRPLRTDRNAIALGSVTVDPVFHAIAVTNRGELVKSMRISLNSPTSGSKHNLDMMACVGSRSFEYERWRWGNKESKNGR